MKYSWQKTDTGLTARIIICFAILTILYLGFITILYYLGLGFIPIVIISGAFILGQWFFSDKIVLWSTGAKIVTKEQYPVLHEIIERIVSANGMHKPKIAVINSRVPNAFATGKGQRSSVVAVTSSLMDILDYDELEGVLAHELTHIKNRDVMVITLASLFSTIAWQIMQFGFFGGMYGAGRDRNNGGAILIIIAVAFVTWIVSFLIIRAISRYREFSADRGSAQMTGKPAELANALMKISGSMNKVPTRDLRHVEGYNAFFIVPAISGKTIANLFATHPPVEKRVERLLSMERSMY
ncbi:zinc metalloprotease HtpX [Candidatus Nitrosocosmicus franklandus]|uniref:Protease HtpX homolog n=1 Tax=Candidatus Nitrosocosmicus franklandianus TaxID=1798806 RepID=A0A484IAD7_9ARCH|nr:zinc metalloprotease HtpX [Candidatus Nitrosocosmicus franklandus]VFJ13733.1 Protease HtpX homolog 2 [Candidatus Nitrosocosmicus franklandus]